MIIEVKSFQANQFLNGHTRHCIKDYSSQWDNYVSSHNNKQYYIYNFNIPQYDNLSTIGITIQPGQSVRACHAKDDANIMNSIKGILKKWEGEYDIKDDIFAQLKPMTDESFSRAILISCSVAEGLFKTRSSARRIAKDSSFLIKSLASRMACPSPL